MNNMILNKEEHYNLRKNSNVNFNKNNVVSSTNLTYSLSQFLFNNTQWSEFVTFVEKILRRSIWLLKRRNSVALK